MKFICLINNFCKRVLVIEFNTDIDTSNVEDFHGMFNGCYKLKKLDVRKFNTSKAVSMMQMFCQCGSLQHRRFQRTRRLQRDGGIFEVPEPG